MSCINKPSFEVKLTKYEPIPLALAPLAGITDVAFRALCLEVGQVNRTIIPMIGARALLHPSSRSKTLRLIDFVPWEKDREVQIFGSDPQEMAEAARIIADLGAKIININLGCQVPKVIKEGSGSYLLKDYDKILYIIEAVVQVLPVTLKIRLGWDKFDILPLIKKLEGWPVLAIYVHGRTAIQAFSGNVDKTSIAEIVKSTSIPVWANGDITNTYSAQEMLKETNCYGLMIGRAVLGNPNLFRKINNLPPLDKDLLVKRHLELSRLYCKGSECSAVYRLRRHFLNYDLGKREDILRAECFADLEATINN